MRKISVFVMLTSIFFFTGCEKDRTNSDHDVKNFIKVLQEYQFQKDTKSDTKKDIPFKYDKNPYDVQGELHNALLDRFFKEIYGVVDSSLYFVKFFEMTKIKWNETPEYYIASLEKIREDVYNEKGYNPTFINNHNHISTTGKGILNAYFTKMSDLDIKDRIELSKVAEDFLLNEEVKLPKEERQSILSSFAIFRYSNYYWEYQVEGFPAKAARQCAMWDAAGYYLAAYTDWPAVEIADGKDIYAFAAFYSTVMGFALGGGICR